MLVSQLPVPLLVRLMLGSAGCSLILHLNEQGQIDSSLQSLHKEASLPVSEVEDDNGVLYLGSVVAPFIGKLDLTKIKV